MARLIGIFGGTFDPVHYGHLRPALDVMNALKLSEVRFIPNAEPPHREAPWLSVEQRKQLLNLALQEQSGFVLDERELNRSGKSFMVDTLLSLRNEFPKSHLCLILGMDAMAGIRQWHQWKKILGLCHIVVTQRPGHEWKSLINKEEFGPFLSDNIEDLKREAAGRILLQSVTQVDLSASKIRQQLKNGQDIRQLMPEKAHQLLMQMIQRNDIEAVNDN